MTFLIGLLSLALAAAGPFDAKAVADQSTLEFLTVGPEEGEHWSTVWFVVIDGAVCLRLGPRAIDRVERHKDAPTMKIRFGADEVYEMRFEKVSDMGPAIAQAMYEKYWTDIIGEPFRRLGLTSEPMMLRLVPAAAGT